MSFRTHDVREVEDGGSGQYHRQTVRLYKHINDTLTQKKTPVHWHPLGVQNAPMLHAVVQQCVYYGSERCSVSKRQFTALESALFGSLMKIFNTCSKETFNAQK